MPLKTRQSSNIQGALLLLALVGGVVYLVLREVPPSYEVAIPLSNGTPTASQPSWQEVLQQQFVAGATALPQAALPNASYAPPTLEPTDPGLIIALEPTQLFGTVVPTNTPLPPPPSPTYIGPTPVPLATNSAVEVVNVAGGERRWQPPPLSLPISRDPRDHYWLARPVDSSAVNYALFYYSYGSDGPEDAWRVHHGVDMPNPIGESVRAAGPGTVIWAADGFRVELPDGSIAETTYSYGNTVLIEHDFGYRGQPIYTLYAHLSAILVTRGQRVQTGDIIGLVGDTGVVTGSHVHFEVRVGRNSWYAVRNPLLWMVPYVGHGVIAGRIVGLDGELLDDQDISIIDRRTGRVVQTASSYVRVDINKDGLPDVVADDAWNENFVAGDIPEGQYQVVARIDGMRVTRLVEVYEGTTTFVELAPPEQATPQPAPAEAGS